MAFWKYREELSLANKLRRSYYELLRDDLDQFITQHALIDSYQNFISRGVPYPFVLQKIVVEVFPKTYFIRTVSLYESSGNVAVFEFSNLKPNLG